MSKSIKITFDELPSFIRTERERQQLTQQQLAWLADTQQRHISAIESGNSNMTLKMLTRIFDALKVNCKLDIG